MAIVKTAVTWSQVMPNVEELISEVLGYNPQADVGLIRQTYEFAAKAHEGQVRKSGEPFLKHPLEVAHILARMKMDVPSIVVGFLHDTVEDSLTTVEDIAEKFGKEIAELVEGLTKISRVEFMSREEKQAENFRKMIISMGKDIRVILIKLADRLHNMRTLEPLPPDKQKRIAQETVEIYAPIANRLGIGWMKVELEDLSLQYLEPEIYGDLTRKMAVKRTERDKDISEIIEIVKQNLKVYGFKAEVYGRTKHFYSIHLKMASQEIPFEEIYDLSGIRIITDTEMHGIAEEGIAAHWKYKERGQIDTRDNQIYNWLRQMVEWQKALSDSRQFLDSVKVDLFQDVVYVFTPRGDVKELIRGATPVDLAYASIQR